MITFVTSFLLAALAMHAPPVMARATEPAARVNPCPTPEPDAQARIHRLLTTPLIAELRARYDLGTAAAEDVRLLTNERDALTCEALRNAVDRNGSNLAEGDRVTFFRSGDRFFVPVTRERAPGPPGTIHLDGYSSLDVYDSEFRLIGRFMS